MDKKKAFDSGSQWISDEQRIHETSDYGRNKRAVNDALEEQQRRVKLVQEYAKGVENAKAAAKTTSEQERISEEYEELKQVAEHREKCLKDIAQIASLEDIFNTLSVEFAQRASSLVVDACSEAAAAASPSAPGEESASQGGGDGIARAAQSCILAVRNNWNWISKLVKCSDVHLKHASDYHQFFHEAKEYEQWMPAELNKHVRSLEEMTPEEDDDSALLKMLKEVLAIFLHWQNKTNVLFDKSRKIVPVHHRTRPLDHFVPVTSLCDYKTNEITIQEGEELTLLDNSRPQIWLVRNMHSKESQVPSVICVIPGPDTEAVSIAMRLRLQLLKTWTVCVKHIGRVVILYFGLVLKAWDEDAIRKLQSMTDDDKMRSLQTLQWILDIFSRYWKDDPQFRDLMVRIERTRTVLRGDGDPKDYDSTFSREYITRIKIIEELLTHFRNYLKQWEIYKLLAEASRQSDYMLLMQNWEELNFFSTEEVLRKVSFELEVSGGQKDVTDNVVVQETENTVVEETIEKVEATLDTTEADTVEEDEETTTTFERVHQTAEAEQYLHAEQEERKKFVITGNGGRNDQQRMSPTEDTVNLSPRLPGDGTEHADTAVAGPSESTVPLKSSEEYLDQSLIQRISSTEKQSRLYLLKQKFHKKHSEWHGSSDVPQVVNRSESGDMKYPASPKSPKKLSKIPRFSSSETIDAPADRPSKGASSKIPKPMFHSKSVSMDHLNTSHHMETVTAGSTMSSANTSVSSIDIREGNLNMFPDHQHDEGNNWSSYRRTDRGTPVLIYTEETESMIGVPRKDEAHKPKMCSVATQYEVSDDLFPVATTKFGGQFSGVDKEEEQTALGSVEYKTEIVNTKSETDVKTDTHTLVTTEKSVLRSMSSNKGVQERFGYRGTVQSKGGRGSALDLETTDGMERMEAHGQSLRFRGKQKVSGQKFNERGDDSEEQLKSLDTSSDEDLFFLAQGVKQQCTEEASGLDTQRGSLLWAEAAGRNEAGLGMMVSKFTETTATQTEQLELVQGALAALIADRDTDDTSKNRGALCLRICKACLPLQMLMLLLLGLACLFPMSEEEYSCTLSNNFENSLAMMLRHRDGPPPV